MNHFLLLIALLASQVSEASAPTPQRIAPDAVWGKGSAFPFFVAATAAVDANGIPDPKLFDEASRTLLKMEIDRRRLKENRGAGARANAADSGPCDVRIVSFHEWWSVGQRSWDEITRGAQAAVRGSVVGTTPGFLRMTPVTLVTIRIHETVFASVPFPRNGLIHVIYPIADFRVAGSRFCQVNGSGFEPSPGDEVLLLASDSPSDDTGAFVTPVELIFNRGGRLIVPDTVTDRDQLSSYGSLAALSRSIPRQ